LFSTDYAVILDTGDKQGKGARDKGQGRRDRG
jgi:hypothetical protein